MEMRETNQSTLEQPWLALQIFNFYRLCLIALLASVYSFDIGDTLLGDGKPDLFIITMLLYIIMSVMCLVATFVRKPAFNTQVTWQVFTDIVALTLLIHSSLFLMNTLAILMIASIAGGSILTAGRTSLLFAAVASLAILGERLYSNLVGYVSGGFEQAGILGAMFFAIAILGYALSRRIRHSEAIALQRGRDIAKLQMLNDYIVQHMRSGIIVVDSDDCVKLINPAAWHLLEQQARDEQKLQAISQPLLNRLSQWRKDSHKRQDNFKHSDNSMELFLQFIPLQQDDACHTVIFLDDSTRAAQQAQQMKLASLGRFTASVAHEIRNPLGAISHAGQLLAESEISSGDSRLVEIINENVDRMNRVIKNVLQLSRRTPPQMEKVSLDYWIDYFVGNYKKHHREPMNISVDIQTPELMVWVDSSQLYQVLTNLCDNGLRFSQLHSGEAVVTIRAAVKQETGQALIDVLDQGPGISEEIVGNIFEPFFTTDRSGTGLGLYLCKEICEANQAELSYIKSNSGACFRIVFHYP